VVRIEAGADGAQSNEGAYEQRSADEQDQRERDFGNYQRRAHTVLPLARTGPAAFLKGGSKVGIGSVQRWEESKENAGQQSGAGGKCGDAPIERRSLDSAIAGEARNISGNQRQQTAHTPGAKRKPDEAADAREQDAFRQQLAQHAAAACANGGADTEFALARSRTSQQQVGHV